MNKEKKNPNISLALPTKRKKKSSFIFAVGWYPFQKSKGGPQIPTTLKDRKQYLGTNMKESQYSPKVTFLGKKNELEKN